MWKPQQDISRLDLLISNDRSRVYTYVAQKPPPTHDLRTLLGHVSVELHL